MALVAIVDDSKLARVFAAASLKHAGHEVAEVEPTGLAEVLEILRNLKPDLMVLDQLMPGFSGSSLVRACFEDDLLESLRVVMLTALHDEAMDHRMEKLGVHAILYKPISPSELARTVAEVLER